jgi:hypothetical protein
MELWGAGMKHRYWVWMLQGRPDPWPGVEVWWDDLSRWWLREPTPEQIAQAAAEIMAEVEMDVEWEWDIGEVPAEFKKVKQAAATPSRLVRQADNSGFGWGVAAGLFLGGGA